MFFQSFVMEDGSFEVDSMEIQDFVSLKEDFVD
jgi:hypothetical protein